MNIAMKTVAKIITGVIIAIGVAVIAYMFYHIHS